VNGKIQLKDLGNGSYIEKGFYMRISLPSEEFCILNLTSKEDKAESQYESRLAESFEFRKRSDKNTGFSVNQLHDSQAGLLDETTIQYTREENSEVRDGLKINTQDEEEEPAKISSMDIYEELHDIEMRLVLTNISQFLDDSHYEPEPEELDKKKQLTMRRASVKMLDFGSKFGKTLSGEADNLDQSYILDKLEFQIEMEKEEHARQEAIRDRWYILNHNNNAKFYWDVFVILLAIYNAVALPMRIAFD